MFSNIDCFLSSARRLEMSNQATIGKNRESVWPFVAPNATDLLQAQVKTLSERQAEFLDETEKLMTLWTKRRQEAVEDGMRTLQAAWACKDAAAVMTLYRDWLSGSLTRIFADIGDAREQAFRLAEIGQRSMTALWRPNPDLASPAPPADMEKQERKGRSLPRMEAAHEDQPSSAAA
jgi:Phasin protein